MLNANPEVLLYANDTGFFEYAAFHLAALGVKVIPVEKPENLTETVRNKRPNLVLLHWDTLGEGALRQCLFLRNCLRGTRAQVAIVSERPSGAAYDEEEAQGIPAPNVTAAFASGADDLIEGAANPRLFISRIKVLLGWRQDPQQLAAP